MCSDLNTQKPKSKKISPYNYPTKERVRSLFDYCEDGSLFWKKREESDFPTRASANQWNGAFAGKVCGHKRPRGGQISTTIDKKFKSVHRLIWIWHFGDIPDGLVVDHIDGDQCNNRIENLRIVTHQVNSRNKKLNNKNKSGCTGVTWIAAAGKWRAQAKIGEKHVHLGYYENKDEAINAARTYRKRNQFSERHVMGFMPTDPQ